MCSYTYRYCPAVTGSSNFQSSDHHREEIKIKSDLQGPRSAGVACPFTDPTDESQYSRFRGHCGGLHTTYFLYLPFNNEKG